MAGTIKAGTLTDGTNTVSMEGACRGTAKAWAHFTNTAVASINSSFNVTSITDRGVGLFTLNLTKPLTKLTPCVVGSGTWVNNSYSATHVGQFPESATNTGSVEFVTTNSTSGKAADSPTNYVVIFGD